jgi:phage portal protein BeeE
MRLLDRLVPQQRAGLAEGYFGGEWDPFGGAGVFSVGGQTYTSPVTLTMPGEKTEGIANNFVGYVSGGLMGNSVIFGLASVRIRVFSEARFQYQRFNKGRPGDLWGDQSLAILESPWPGGTTGDLLAIMLLHADFAGNAYIVPIGGQLVAMRPDWVEIILGARRYVDAAGRVGTVGLEKLGYHYYQGGKNSGVEPVSFLADEVAHFAPQPDPLASYRGMSWLTPVIREIRADGAATNHKLKYFENAATPNLAVSLKEITDPTQFAAFVDKMDDTHRGWQNAYKTLYLGAGADVTVIGSNLAEIDFRAVQGFGETRLAQAAGVPPTVACLSEGLQGSSLNAGNFGQARRQFADTTMSALWRNAAGSLATLVSPPDPASRLWYDTRDIPFLREDQKDQSEIQSMQATAVRTLVEAGYEPSSVIAAIAGNDLTLLKHTGLFSIQLQEAGSPKLPEPPAVTGVAKADSFNGDGDGFYQRMTELLRAFPAINVTTRPVVNVAPAEVTVEAAQVNVPATVVNVETPPLPVAKTRTVQRDGLGRITKVVEE